MHRQQPSYHAGFTLIEVIAALLILGILAAVVVVSSMNTETTASESAMLAKVKNHLRYARNRSMSSQDQWGVVISGDGYELERLPWDTDESLFFPGEELESVEIEGDLALSGRVFFDEWGRPIDENGDSISFSSSGITINQTTGYIQ
ncbi:MAG: type II secretion system protein [Thermodesulfobacteriota bacterium]|nr:type II secretion system protein [Thermodesulfobacteriota bacterium]